MGRIYSFHLFSLTLLLFPLAYCNTLCIFASKKYILICIAIYFILFHCVRLITNKYFPLYTITSFRYKGMKCE